MCKITDTELVQLLEKTEWEFEPGFNFHGDSLVNHKKDITIFNGDKFWPDDENSHLCTIALFIKGVLIHKKYYSKKGKFLRIFNCTVNDTDHPVIKAFYKALDEARQKSEQQEIEQKCKLIKEALE